MTTIAKIAISVIFSILLMSCGFTPGIQGNGNVTITKRDTSKQFEQIEVSRGLDVYLTQDDITKISVEADENLQDIITTEINNGVLKISTIENIGSSTSKKISVSFNNIESISSSSGSDIYTTNTIVVESLKLESSSGADLEAEVETKNLECTSSSGSDLKVSGTTKKLYVKASSGSDINASNLVAEYGNASASSGSDITLNTSGDLDSKSSSGGSIRNIGKD